MLGVAGLEEGRNRPSALRGITTRVEVVNITASFNIGLADHENQLVKQHFIESTDPRFVEIDAAVFAPKNLWNAANYILQQAFIHHHRIVDWKELYRVIKSTDACKPLPRKAFSQVLIPFIGPSLQRKQAIPNVHIQFP